MSAAGVGPSTHVVAYDDQAGAMAARLWFLLRAFGHDAVSILDGGITKWSAEGRPLETAGVRPPPAAFVPRERPGWVLDKAAMVREREASLVLDARAASRFRGESDPIDPRAGHIPGARHAPYAENLTAGAVPVLRPPAELRARYAALGAEREPPIVYCGSGVTACHDLLALEVAGLPGGRLYAGSWSEWSADPDLPLATGGEG
jgi:thiosulfate/3-mercaptopyruvate sulfurtransferase